MGRPYYRPYFHQSRGVVREVTAEVMIEKYRINLTFLLIFASLRFSAPSSFILFYFTVIDEGYRTMGSSKAVL